MVVASFYLPVTLTKQAGQSGRDRWVARWDYEQLVALQVRYYICCSYGISCSVNEIGAIVLLFLID